VVVVELFIIERGVAFSVSFAFAFGVAAGAVADDSVGAARPRLRAAKRRARSSCADRAGDGDAFESSESLRPDDDIVR